MSKIIKWAVALLAAVALAGCAPTIDVDEPMVQPVSTVQDRDTRFDATFTKALKEQMGIAPSRKMTQAAREAGTATCEAFRAGDSVGDIEWAIANAADGDGKLLGVLIIAAATGVQVYCPEYLAELNR